MTTLKPRLAAFYQRWELLLLPLLTVILGGALYANMLRFTYFSDDPVGGPWCADRRAEHAEQLSRVARRIGGIDPCRVGFYNGCLLATQRHPVRGRFWITDGPDRPSRADTAGASLGPI